jgi:signal transduction histidine kinase
VLARELHDQVGHNLTALNLNLTRLKNELAGSPAGESGKPIGDSLALVEDTAQRVRHIMSSLRPPMLDDYGLFATLRWWAHESALRSGMTIEVTGAEAEPRLPNNVELTLFRVAQEALLNAIKHSGAKRIVVSLDTLPGSVRLAISDDGRGMALDKGNEEKQTLLRVTWGMLNMRERTEAVGGSLRVASTPGAGVRVLVDLPRKRP